jgi:hypothetical protein
MITDTIPMTAVATTRSRSFNRIAAIAGIAFSLCVVASLILVGSIPTASDNVAKLRAYFTDNPGSHQAGLLVIGLSIIPAFLFLAGLVGVHRDVDRRHGEQWTVAIVGFFVFANALNAVGQAIDAGLLLSKGANVSDGSLVASWDISIASLALMTLAFGATALAVGVPVLVHGVRPAWYGWFSLLTGALGLLSLGTLVSHSSTAETLGLLILPAFIIWVIAGSALLYRDA